jgi:hypothetical protein
MSFITDSIRNRAGQEIIDIQNSVQTNIATLKSLKVQLSNIKQKIIDEQTTFTQDDITEITSIYNSVITDISNI